MSDNDEAFIDESNPVTATIIAEGTYKPISKKQKLLDLDDDDLDEGSLSTLTAVGTIFSERWSAQNSKTTDLKLLLSNFSFYSPASAGLGGNQTLILQLVVPTNSIGFAINLSPTTMDPNDMTHLSHVFFHFNPRFMKKIVVMNHMNGNWGQEWRRPLGTSRLPYPAAIAFLPTYLHSVTVLERD